ncbi:MAG: peptidyl-prolyl cis-trans isomerase [Cyclobacteriaceae bacterium]|nr:peptidyl-prolyl cis-trans isomerase [Cyclobacteriaceae bacterium]MCK5208499.1 peptidyl-prolyl cis-trans isomerase [Cyclobacteriaceae bacterium]MCK5276892.1 peptidyl-prolyl cis-trans isomerase [Cyclobacteriaceae bacterium]MCK5705661.1 peptidyl-prolyl cis-trans isomerase [Cyclobacteriaceae bacterium]
MIKLKNYIRNSLIILVSILYITSCEFLQFKKGINGDTEPDAQPLASVGDMYLFPRDVEGIVPPGISKNDSIDLMERHIKSWIKKQLLITEAQNQLTFDEVELERRVLDYRYALMMHEFEKYTIARNINVNISEEEIELYYQENIENFELKQNIIRGYFIQLSKDAPNIGRFRYLLKSNREKDIEELKSYSFSYGTKVHLDDSIWVNFEDVINNTPFMDIPNKTDFLRRNKYHEVPDDKYIFFLKISQYKIQNDTSPLEFVRDDIQKIILNKRKVSLAKKLEEDIYKNAIENEDFKIYKQE